MHTRKGGIFFLKELGASEKGRSTRGKGQAASGKGVSEKGQSTEGKGQGARERSEGGICKRGVGGRETAWGKCHGQ